METIAKTSRADRGPSILAAGTGAAITGALAWVLLDTMGSWYAGVSLLGGGAVVIAFFALAMLRVLPGWLLGALLLVAAIAVSYVAAGCPAILWR